MSVEKIGFVHTDTHVITQLQAYKREKKYITPEMEAIFSATYSAANTILGYKDASDPRYNHPRPRFLNLKLIPILPSVRKHFKC